MMKKITTINRNIRGYKVISSDGEVCFEEKRSDDRGSGSCSDIHNLAYIIALEVKSYHKNDGFGQVTIDLKPFHEIECPSGLACSRKFELNEQEKEEFWKEFNKLV